MFSCIVVSLHDLFIYSTRVYLFIIKYSCMLLYKLQVYNIVIHNF